MRALLIGLGALVVIAFAAWQFVLGNAGAQDVLMARGLDARMGQAPQAPPEGGIRVFMCGTSSPLPNPDRAQACVAVLVDDRIFVVDAGAASAGVASTGPLALENLRALLVTHYHSDHIADIPEFNLISWVAGRPAPLQIIGPAGVETVVSGLNRTYALDNSYRVAHHGAELLPPELGVLEARTIEAGVIIDEDGLVITAFPVNHAPISPAVGYRFDYGGRSVVVTGDTIVTDGLEAAARDADLLLSDGLSTPIVQAMEKAARENGQPRRAKIFFDIQDYHASITSMVEMAERVGVRQLAFYHLVPAPANALLERIWRRDLPDDVMLTDDYMTFDLPAGSDAIIVED
ncbi:MAG: MBL fold metallo-hydrolase [Pseudomonadales bacterium]|jgi:ribonuclease Z|nr:MBL fold metallo-hydrolase [Pseudomonadales bacterium]